MRNLSRLIPLFFCLFYPFFIIANSSPDVVINEIAWMGTASSFNDEWIELYNNTPSEIDLSDWAIKAGDGNPEIELLGKIAAFSFYILERTDDTTLPDITADQIYKGSLSNQGEKLEFYDSEDNLIDKIDCSEGWFAGDNASKRTMERKNSLSILGSSNWQTSENIGGTPKVKNSEQKQKELIETDAPQLPENSPPQVNPATSLAGIFFNELLPSPEGPDKTEEWIEIFNPNDSQVNLSFWKIRDSVGQTKVYTFPEDTFLDPQKFLILSRPTTGITLNNSGDALNLLDPEGKTADTVSYQKAPRGSSYGLAGSTWSWSSQPTPGSVNIILPSLSRQEEPKSNQQEIGETIPTEPVKDVSQEELAAIGEQISGSSSFLSLLSIAISWAVFSGIIILIIKRKLEKIDKEGFLE